MADLKDDVLDDLWNSPGVASPIKPPVHAERLSVANGGEKFIENCAKCGGTGRFRNLGPCFTCKGKGKLTFKTSREDRSRARANKVAREARAEATAIEAFKVAHPDVWAWMDGNSFSFAVAMVENLKKWGSLTDNQLAACRRAMAKLAEARAAREAQKAACSVTLDGIEKAFDAARASGKKAPMLRMPGITLACAKATSRNPGAIYVKRGRGGEYLGKIVAGKFQPTRECTNADRDALLEAAKNPAEAAIRYGRETGSCACCGKLLTDPVSVAAGIGPICAAGFGF